MGVSKEVLDDPDPRIPELTDKLQEMRKVDEMMHPEQRFTGQVIIDAEKQSHFELIRKVMFASASAGYVDFNYAVRTSALGPPLVH